MTAQQCPECTRPPCPHCHPGTGTASGWLKRKGPAPLLRRRHQLSEWAPLPDWVDHPYRRRRPELLDGWAFICEPYELFEDAIEDLHYLAGNGWKVMVSGERALHFPGSTVAIDLTRPAPKIEPR